MSTQPPGERPEEILPPLPPFRPGGLSTPYPGPPAHEAESGPASATSGADPAPPPGFEASQSGPDVPLSRPRYWNPPPRPPRPVDAPPMYGGPPPGHVPPPAAYGSSGPPPPPPPPRPSSRGPDWRIVLCACLAVLVAAFGAVFYFVESPSKAPKTGLEDALVAMDSSVTADMTLAVNVSVGSFTFGVKATGTVDFANKAASLHLNGFGMTLSVVEVNGVAYVKPGTWVSKQFPGKTWVKIPDASLTSGQRGSQLFTTGDPEKLLSVLVKLGGTVSSAPPATIDGTHDQGYRIRFTLADLKAHAAELPPSFRSIFSTLKHVPQTVTVTTTVYVDPAGQLQAVDLGFNGQFTGQSAKASVDLTFSNFGAAAAPAAPPATRTVTYSQFKSSGSGQLPFTAPSGAGSTA